MDSLVAGAEGATSPVEGFFKNNEKVWADVKEGLKPDKTAGWKIGADYNATGDRKMGGDLEAGGGTSGVIAQSLQKVGGGGAFTRFSDKANIPAEALKESKLQTNWLARIERTLTQQQKYDPNNPFGGVTDRRQDTMNFQPALGY